jgi:hypothetical protein
MAVVASHVRAVDRLELDQRPIGWGDGVGGRVLMPLVGAIDPARYGRRTQAFGRYTR